MIKISDNGFFLFCTLLIISTDLAIFLNIPFLRQIVGFLFLTILPGLLILRILILNKIGLTEKFVLMVGLSISFLMFFGLLSNTLSLGLGYQRPLSTISLLIAFNIAFVLLAIIGSKINKAPIFSLPNLNLTTSEKAFLIVPILFPALSIVGIHLMNTSDNNIFLMLLLVLIPTYVASVCFFNYKFPNRLYPVVIFLISISLLLLLSLRSNHIIGGDVHKEYYFFQIIFDNLHWSIYRSYTLSACLSISVLPVIYQSILNTSPEFLFKIFHSLIFSVSPLIIYIISKKYIKDSYAFLASIFFMSQGFFIYTEMNPRTSMAILFFALAMMTLFSDKIDSVKKRILFIVFMASCIVSHYSTAYMFFFILLGAFVGTEILSKKYTFKKVINLTMVVLFFALIFFWYSQVTATAFHAGVDFIRNVLTDLNSMFIEEASSESMQSLFGGELTEEDIPYKIQFFLYWTTFTFIGIGLITCIIRYKEMLYPELNFKKVDFLKEKFDIEYFIVALTCTGVLVAVATLPYITKGYDMSRPYAVVIVILSLFFVIGGIMIAKYLNQLIAVLQGKASTENALQVRTYFVILLVWVPYFLCVSGVTYAMFGEPRSLILNSEGEEHEYYYVYDSESCAAKWLMRNAEKNIRIHTMEIGRHFLMSQGKIASSRFDDCLSSFLNHKKVEGYIYLYYDNVVEGKLINHPPYYNMSEYSDMFIGTNKIYGNGGSEVYKA